jgi:hypothetical protein
MLTTESSAVDLDRRVPRPETVDARLQLGWPAHRSILVFFTSVMAVLLVCGTSSTVVIADRRSVGQPK